MTSAEPSSGQRKHKAKSEQHVDDSNHSNREGDVFGHDAPVTSSDPHHESEHDHIEKSRDDKTHRLEGNQIKPAEPNGYGKSSSFAGRCGEPVTTSAPPACEKEQPAQKQPEAYQPRKERRPERITCDGWEAESPEEDEGGTADRHQTT